MDDDDDVDDVADDCFWEGVKLCNDINKDNRLGIFPLQVGPVIGIELPEYLASGDILLLGRSIKVCRAWAASLKTINVWRDVEEDELLPSNSRRYCWERSMGEGLDNTLELLLVIVLEVLVEVVVVLVQLLTSRAPCTYLSPQVTTISATFSPRLVFFGKLIPHSNNFARRDNARDA